MCASVIKFWCIFCFVICGVVSFSVNAIETTGDALTGNFTEIRDPCSNNPCKNGGVCTVNNTGYICKCKEPYSGEHCQIHPCHSNPCFNDGACIAVENTYGCVCDEPFYGKHCENDPCSSRPCTNGGLCQVDGIRFNCLCKPPYAGPQCEIILQTTVFETIGNTASEILTSTSYGFRSTSTDDESSEESREHFTFGTTKNYDECYCGPNSVRCELDWWKNKVCFCKPGFGQRRGMENCTRTCSSNSDCYNYGTCDRDGPDNFCLCPEPFVGEFCQIDACDQSVRLKCDSMGAKCVVKGNTGVCECPFGKKLSPRSDFCEEICTPQICVHGRCEITRNNTYACKCFDGSYGIHCEINPKQSTLWGVIIMILALGIVFFCIASIIAGCWVKKLKKKIGENAKNTHHP